MTQQPANDLEAPVLVGALDDLGRQDQVRDDVSSVMTPIRSTKRPGRCFAFWSRVRIMEKQDRGPMEPNPDVLRANAYHEAGHAIVGWALGLNVQEIAIRDDRPGENTKFTGHAEHLPLVDQVAICNAGRQAEETFRHLLPSWASGGDWADTLNLLAAYDICENPEIDQWFANGRARARELLIKHRREVRRLAARLIESRRMTADEFERFMQASM